MTRRHVASLVGGVLCLIVAAGLVVFARDLHAWPSAFAEGDATFQAKPGGERPWESPDVLPMRPAQKLLDVNDDVTMRRAIRLFQLSSDVSLFQLGFVESGRPVQPTRRLLLRIGKSDADPRIRARAANLLAVMTYNGGGIADASLITGAARLLRQAIVLDPTNEEAKFNLELLMFTSPENTSSRQAAGGAGRVQPDANGAGSTPPGSGY